SPPEAGKPASARMTERKKGDGKAGHSPPEADKRAPAFCGIGIRPCVCGYRNLLTEIRVASSNNP
ncbi:hypothetical protein KAS50_01705, partial [bacterium]|nr:hypothetical protein [bacterium]